MAERTPASRGRQGESTSAHPEVNRRTASSQGSPSVRPRPSNLEIAHKYESLGWVVLPARLGEKSPRVAWKVFASGAKPGPLTEEWFGGDQATNFWIVCGQSSGIVVIDCDSPEARDWLQEQVPDLNETWRVATTKGWHYYFKAPDQPMRGWSIHDEDSGIHIDVRADGAGVIVPPSVHPSGTRYRWEQAPWQFPGSLLNWPGLQRPQDASLPRDSKGVSLEWLLDNRPVKGDRNNWLAKVAGHVARQDYPDWELYEKKIVEANKSLDHPLPKDEVEKTTASIWQAEERKREEAKQATEEAGFLAGDGDRLMSPVPIEGGGIELKEWSDFDLRARKVAEGERRVFMVDVCRNRWGDVVSATLDASTLANHQKLQDWAFNLGVSIAPPPKEITRLGQGTRVLRYLEHQRPPVCRIVPHLGWTEGVGFVCHEGVITKDGLQPHDKIMPDPILQVRAPYRYGFSDTRSAIGTLREVLTYHDESVASIFGAWWVSCLLKPQLKLAGASQFPYIALEAPSESGKTTGFFSLMIQLNGNFQGQAEYTLASLRDRVSAHHSGVVWIDDISDPRGVHDIIRQATMEGSRAKMATDNRRQETVQMVAPVVLSGEGLEIQEKALLDRSIPLEAPSPIGRRSVRDPSRPQWDDVVRLRRHWNQDLTQCAGTLVQLVLRKADIVADWTSFRGEQGGRLADKLAILRLGAALLSDLVGDPSHMERVETWTESVEESQNALILRMLPELLAQSNWPRGASSVSPWGGAVPVFVDRDLKVWFTDERVATCFRKHVGTQHYQSRLHSQSAITAQRRAMGLVTDGAPKWVDRAAGLRVRYHCLSDELSQMVLDLSGWEGSSG